MIPAKAAAVAVLVGVLLASGCTTPFGGGSGLTAKDASSRVAPQAQQWKADAMLVGAGTVEYRSSYNQSANISMGFPFAPQPDANPGDGRASQWYLRYASHSAGNVTLNAVVYANGTVLTKEDHGSNDNEAGVQASAWQVDSPQAAQVAMQDANFSRVAQQSDSVVGMFLSPAGGGPYMANNSSTGQDPFWVLFTGSNSSHDGASVFVNARTGERFAIPSFGFPFGTGGNYSGDYGGGYGSGGSSPPKAFAFQGQVTAAKPMAAHSFQVTADQQFLSGKFTWSGTLPTDSGTFTIKGPSGTLGTQTLVGSNQSGGNAWPTQGAGEYTATVALGSGPPPGVQGSYTITIYAI